MKFDNSNEMTMSYFCMDIVHANNRLTFKFKDKSVYRKIEEEGVPSIFEYCNSFLEVLDTKEQKEIFTIYTQVKKAIDNVVDDYLLAVELSKLVRNIYKIIKLEDIATFMKRKGHLKIPVSIKSEFSELDIADRNQEGKQFKERSYLRQDYINIVNMAVYLKFMIPIWAEYMGFKKNKQNQNKFKEYEAMRLLTKTEIMDSEPMRKLRTMIEIIIKTNALDKQVQGNLRYATTTLDGVCTNELPDLYLAQVVVNDLVIAPLSTYDSTNHVVTICNRSVNRISRKIESPGKFKGRIEPKKLPSEDKVDDDNLAITENYKIKEMISSGDMAAYIRHSDNYRIIHQKIGGDNVCLEILDDFINIKSKININEHLKEPQRILLGWMLHTEIPIYALESIPKDKLEKLTVVVQSILYQWGYVDLAMFITARPFLDSFGNHLGSSEIKTRISKGHKQELLKWYPYDTRLYSKLRNSVVTSIDLLVDKLSEGSWVIDMPDRYTQHIKGPFDRGNKSMTFSGDIMTQLANLCIDIAKMQERVFE